MATLLDKLLVFPALGLVFGKTLFSATTGPFRGPDGAPTLTEHVRNTFLRGLVGHLSVEQIQWVSPSFVATYRSWCSKHSLTPDIVDIPNTKPGVQGFWLGSKSTAKYTMVFYHGGGFAAPGTPDHLNMLLNVVKWSNNNIAIFCVAYTLSIAAAYPTAIAQSVEGLRYILDLPGHSPSTTLLGGDSAGGNLVLAVLSHISGHPHPQSDIVRPLAVNGPLKAAMLIAPWTSSETYPSTERYRNRDYVNKICADYWIEAYKGRGKGVADDEYICAVLAGPEWWKDVKCEHALVTAGEHEVLVDAISDWVTKYKEGAGPERITYVIGEKEVHDTPLHPLPEAELIAKGNKAQEGAIRLWVKERFT